VQVGSDGITALLMTSHKAARDVGFGSGHSGWLGGYMSLPGSDGLHALVSQFDARGVSQRRSDLAASPPRRYSYF
jgi:hypothetical protein